MMESAAANVNPTDGVNPDVSIDVNGKRPDLDDQNWVAMQMDLQLKEKRIKVLERKVAGLTQSVAGLGERCQQLRDMVALHIDNKLSGGSTS